jgi:hypothetical protein
LVPRRDDELWIYLILTVRGLPSLGWALKWGLEENPRDQVVPGPDFEVD